MYISRLIPRCHQRWGRQKQLRTRKNSPLILDVKYTYTQRKHCLVDATVFAVWRELCKQPPCITSSNLSIHHYSALVYVPAVHDDKIQSCSSYMSSLHPLAFLLGPVGLKLRKKSPSLSPFHSASLRYTVRGVEPIRDVYKIIQEQWR